MVETRSPVSPVIDDVKRHGRHYTPPALAQFLAERACAALPTRTRSLRVLDPACGDGELLLASAEALSQLGVPDVEFIGFDLDPDAIAMAKERLAAAGLAFNVIAGNFLELAEQDLAEPFDLLITNPPYVRTQAMGEAASQRLAREFGLRGRVDLTHAFVSLAPKLLATDGVLGLLCSNRFLSTKAGANVRTVLTRDLHVRELFDLGDTKLFAAAVLPAIVIAMKGRAAGDPAPYSRAYQIAGRPSTDLPPLLDALRAQSQAKAEAGGKVVGIEVGELQVGTSDQPWRLTSRTHAQRFAAIEEATWKTFGDLAKIRVGIKTTADAVFIREDWEGDHSWPKPESELLLPLLTHDNLTAWRPPSDPKTRVLYPYDLKVERRRLLDLTPYPGTSAYLANHEQRLRARKYVTEAGREWYEIWVPQRPGLWAVPKIVFPDISELPRFALDRSGAVVNGDCYWISVGDLPNEDVAYLMIGIANSELAVEFYDHVCGNKLYSGRRRWITQYVNNFPIPSPDTPAAQEVIAISRKLCEQETSEGTDLLDRLNAAVERSFSEKPADFPDVLF
ncbi:N-6 DNA methylase [Intrasporangium calvum]|uniref:N-6 DNA methylase n=1 Tax=Intrasporangium calvum TaxID=53358 RepID=UPI000DF60720|nr:N-6 DNA methylase [Intrasporangium calvum]AXG15169.1 methyltransferase domain-containing protein [Intrasporangium calvum]